MKFFLSLSALIAAAAASPLVSSASTERSAAKHNERSPSDVAKLPYTSPRFKRDEDESGRVIVYVQTFHDEDDNTLSLLPLLTQQTGVTHVILASLHLNEDPGDIHLNDNPPNATIFDQVWTEVPILQAAGVKVMVMMGGAGDTSANKLAVDFDAYYEPLLAILQEYNLDGLDIDIEESVNISVPMQLLTQLYEDMGPDFILTMAPVASALATKNGGNLSGFSYFDLDEEAVTDDGTPLVSWYNAQFYSGFGSASSPTTYELIVAQGWAPERVVMGVLDSSKDGSGWVSIETVISTITKLQKLFPLFGGVDGWEYFNAGNTDGEEYPWEWVYNISQALTETESNSNLTVSSSVEGLTLYDLPYPASPYSNSTLEQVEALGADHYSALSVLNQTNGDVSAAKSLYLSLTY